MLVIRDGASVVVRYIYVDRNRGQRVEARYRLSPADALIATEMRAIGADGAAGEPTMRFEIAGDSARWTLGVASGRGPTNGGRGPITTAAGCAIRYHRTCSTTNSSWRSGRPANSVPYKRIHSPIYCPWAFSSRVEGPARGPTRACPLQSGERYAPSGLSRRIGTATGRGRMPLYDACPLNPGRLFALLVVRSLSGLLDAPAVATAAHALQSPSIALVDVAVIDEVSPARRPHSTGLIEGQRIASIFPVGSRPLPAGATVLSLPGRFVLPGPIDTHVHVATDPDGEDARQRTERRLVITLRGGVTTVRDMAGDGRPLASLARDARIGSVEAPRIFSTRRSPQDPGSSRIRALSRAPAAPRRSGPLDQADPPRHRGRSSVPKPNLDVRIPSLHKVLDARGPAGSLKP